MTTTTIDCQTCPVRGRHCGDCFVPVLGQIWLDAPRVPAPSAEVGAAAGALEAPATLGLPLDTDELAAVSAFVRAGLVQPQEAARARATVTPGSRYAVG
ncbi:MULTISPECIES: hypothetical protein [unclassified Ornithinimicrobium]|uniref:hypothetical protein n=1 Tax=unclassified Ornithinimicrobium TaxID=2615080 RepID=UPI003852B2EC